MRIANPIYDAVFKYLMEDQEAAKLLLSTILGEEITELDPYPQEHSSTLAPRQLTVYRLDFAATIKNAHGEARRVIIEIQKAKLATDIMRFRRYLGEQYRNPGLFILDENGKKHALPLLSIYFLGHGLEHSRAPVIHVRRESRDLTTNEPLAHKETFIESLTHDSYIIQIPYLRTERRTEIEELLQVFDQSRIQQNRHTLEIDESQVPTLYRAILRRLQRAVAEKEVQENMEVEDDILEELQGIERELEKEKERAEQESLRADKERAEKEQEKQRAEQESLRAEQESQRADRERAEKERLLALLKQAGIVP